MKEATGELSMTVITIIAVVAIAGIVGWLAPKVKTYIENSWDNVAGSCTGTRTWNPATRRCE